jgi:hypothetical protein
MERASDLLEAGAATGGGALGALARTLKARSTAEETRQRLEDAHRCLLLFQKVNLINIALILLKIYNLNYFSIRESLR